MDDASYTIGAVADAADVGVETVRYYERRGLVTQPKRGIGGYRRYGNSHVYRIRFIKRAQALGFTLEEIAGLLELDEAHACAETRELAAHKLNVIENKVADLNAMRKALKTLLRQCDTDSDAGVCPIIHALASD
jgi:MerR family mercuric resistance operon transcriptional regulator